MLDDRPAEGLALLGVRRRVVQRPPGPGRSRPRRSRAVRCRAPARAIRRPSPSAPSRRSTGTRTPSKRIVAVAEPVRPIFRSGGSALSPVGVGGDEEAGDPVAVVAGAGHHLVEVGVAAVGRPCLRAVQDVVVAVAPGARAHRGGVGAGVRLGQAVGAEQVAAEHVGQPALALLVGAGRDQAEARQGVHADAHPDARPGRRDLLQHLEVDLVGLPAAAVLLGVGQAQQAGPAERREDVAGEGLVGLGLGARGRSSRVARSRTSRRRSTDSSVGRTRVAGTRRSFRTGQGERMQDTGRSRRTPKRRPRHDSVMGANPDPRRS